MKDFLHLLTLKMWLHLFILWKKIKSFFLSDYPEQLAQFGELSVTGKDDIKFVLDHRRPSKIIVKFIDSFQPATCNPKQQDQLSYKLRTKYILNSKVYILIISWDVANTRTISWKVCH